MTSVYLSGFAKRVGPPPRERQEANGPKCLMTGTTTGDKEPRVVLAARWSSHHRKIRMLIFCNIEYNMNADIKDNTKKLIQLLQLKA